jgi:hypothetical protein
VHSILVTNDDLVYVADRTNNRLQVFRTDGTFVKEVFIARKDTDRSDARRWPAVSLTTSAVDAIQIVCLL